MADLVITARDIPAGKVVRILNEDGSTMARIHEPNTFGGAGHLKWEVVDPYPNELADDRTDALGRLVGKTKEEIDSEAGVSTTAAVQP